uniref:Metalloendopeptidase n=1 Tax=Meloidogyne enterolobii TaxID=390850 RepID=A0A6V7U4R2_MELEN|nr:unnamed protein product [Meloidogyne enterolobii]
MIIEKKKLEDDESSEEEGVQKSVVKNMSRIWPNNQVPIRFHPSVRTKARRSVQSAVNILEDATCISFPKYNPNRHKNFVMIKSTKKACMSTVGYVDKQGRNRINLERGTHCEEPNTVIHEIMHCLGVSHEQMRYDRDEYIEVLYDNLEPKAVSQYAKQSRKDLETYGEPYDYGSIMHYQVHAGSKNGLPAFRVLRPYDKEYIGNARIPSLIDFSKLNKLYGCPQPDTGDSR